MRTRVVIVGAGVGGLVLGISCRRVGLEVEVLERSEELREVGAAVGLSANGTRVLHEIGVAARLAEAAAEPSELIFRDGRSGARVSAHSGIEYRRRFGRAWWGVHRVDLQRALVEAFHEMSGTRVHLGRAAQSVRQDQHGVGVLLDDGSSVVGDVLVGADGVRSVVREHVVGSAVEPSYSGRSGFRGLVPSAALSDMPDPLAMQIWMGSGGHVVHYPIGADRDTVNFLAVREGPSRWAHTDGSAPTGALLEEFSGWHPAVREMLTAVPQGARWPLLAQPPLRRWTRGRATLLGDACHAMLPHHGQGANQAIEDAATLASLLTATDPTSALALYPRLRRARTRAITLNSREVGKLLHLPDGPAADARDADLARYLDHSGWIHGHDAAQQAREHA